MVSAEEHIKKNKAIFRACLQIAGFLNIVNKLSLLPLYPDYCAEEYFKKPYGAFAKDWPTRNYPFEDFFEEFPEANLGVKLGKESGYLAVIDIDGVKGELNAESVEYIFKALKEHLPNFDQFFIVRTMNGKYHIYFHVKPNSKIINKHELSAEFTFPEDCEIPELAGVHLKGCIEIFDGRGFNENGEEVCNHFMVFPGTKYGDKCYEVISEQNDIDKTPVIEDIEAVLEEAFTLAGFGRYIDRNSNPYADYEYASNGEKVPIPDENIPLLAKFLGDLYVCFHQANCKFYATQALAGYLYRHTDYDSALKLGEAIISIYGVLFKDKKLFLKTLLNDFLDPPAKGIYAQGGTKFYMDYCKDFIDFDVFWQKMCFLMGATMEFYVGKTYARQVNQIVLDRKRCKVLLEKYVEQGKDKNYNHKLDNSKEILGFCPISLKRVSNPIMPNDYTLILKCISPTGEIVIEEKNAKALLDSIKAIPSGVLNHYHFSDVVNQVISKLLELDLFVESERSSVSGVFIRGNELLRFNDDGNPIPIVEPSSDSIANAFSLIKDMLNVLPHDDFEIGLLIRKSFLYPFHYYLKSHGKQIKYICFSGTGGTGKSTLGMLCLSIYQDVKINTDEKIIGGSSFDSPFKIGNAMSASFYGFLVEEPDSAFENHREILKVCTSSLVSRTAGGVKFPAYQSPIFASNGSLPSEPEFLRRVEQFNFTPKYFFTDEIKSGLADLLNVGGEQNKRFESLSVIGDFILFFISQNLNLLDDLSMEDLELRLVDELESKSGQDLSFMKMSKSDEDYYNIFVGEDEYDNTMDIFRKSLREVYNYNKNYVTNKTVKDMNKTFDEIILTQLIKMGVYNYLTLIKADESFIVIKDWEVNNLFKSHGKFGISGIKFYKEYLSNYEKDYEFINSVHKTLDEPKTGKRGTKVHKSFILDLMNGEI